MQSTIRILRIYASQLSWNTFLTGEPKIKIIKLQILYIIVNRNNYNSSSNTILVDLLEICYYIHFSLLLVMLLYRNTNVN